MIHRGLKEYAYCFSKHCIKIAKIRAHTPFTLTFQISMINIFHHSMHFANDDPGLSIFFLSS